MISTLVVVFLTGSMPLASAGSYEQICTVDPEIRREFPIANRRSLERNRIEAVRERVDDGRRLDDTTPVAPLYRCICKNQDFHDNRTTHSYCPLNFSCGIPFDGKPVECVDMEILNGVARMAWPIFITSTLCLILIMSASRYGLAVTKYARKLWRRYWCCSKFTTEDVERQEQEEVDALIQISQQTSQPEVPSRCQVKEYQWYHYHSTILEAARLGWRREWASYCTSLGRAPTELYLPTKAHKNEESVEDQITKETSASAHTDEEEGSDSSTSRFVATVTIIPGDEDGKEDNVDEIGRNEVCSICFADIECGQRIGNLPCRHSFHAACLKTWIGTGRRNNCPLCQAPNIAHRKGEHVSASGESSLPPGNTASSPLPNTSGVDEHLEPTTLL